MGFWRDHRRLLRLVLVAVGLAFIIAIFLVISPLIRVYLAQAVRRHFPIDFLIALEMIYKVVVLLVLVFTPAFGSVVYLSRRSGSSRPVAARGLMLCICCLCGLILSEAIAAARLGWIHRKPPLTKGDQALSDDFEEPTGSDELTLAVLGESSAAGRPYERWLSVG